MNPTRALALALAGGCVLYEWWTIREQERTKAAGSEVNDTWSQITRDVARHDTVVGKRVLAWGLRATCEWFIRHLEEGSTSVSLHREEG